jgi:tetratricopeptide (TPR) repeat protein
MKEAGESIHRRRETPMKTIAYYILRESSRPSEEEAFGLAFGIKMVYAKSHKIDILDAFADNSRQVPIAMAFPYDPAGDVPEQMEKYIAAQGGGHFLNDPDRYEVFIVSSKEGDPPQPTCTAMIIDRGRKAHTITMSEEVQACLDRGRRWEALRRFGDAIHCYEVGRDVYGDHPDLLIRLGTLKLEFEALIPSALDCLKKARGDYPNRTDVLYPLACCYVKLADSNKIQVEDASPRRLKETALSLLEQAIALVPNDERIRSLAQKVRMEIGDDAETFFKGT